MLSFNQVMWWALNLLLVPYYGIARIYSAFMFNVGGAYGAFLASCGVGWCVGIGWGIYLAL